MKIDVMNTLAGVLESHPKLKKHVREIADKIVAPAQTIEQGLTTGAVVLPLKRHLQVDRYSCGAIAAFMILEYYGKARSCENVARELGPDEDNGTREEDIKALFHKRGMSVSTVKSLEGIYHAINRYEAPVLLHVKGDHWAVAYGYSDGSIFVADPSLKKKILCRFTNKEFRRSYWRGHWGLSVDSK